MLSCLAMGSGLKSYAWQVLLICNFGPCPARHSLLSNLWPHLMSLEKAVAKALQRMTKHGVTSFFAPDTSLKHNGAQALRNLRFERLVSIWILRCFVSRNTGRKRFALVTIPTRAVSSPTQQC